MNIRRILISLFLIACAYTFGQVSDQFLLDNSLNSPYSSIGIGDLQEQGFATQGGLGRTSIGLRMSNSINYRNPASYTSQDTTSFILDVGFRSDIVEQKSGVFSHKTSNYNLDHFAISFPIKRWLYGSMGIVPYSKVGYSFTESRIVGPIETEIIQRGLGALAKAYAGFAVEPVSGLSLGGNFNYIFGNIEKTEFRYLPGNQNSSVSMQKDKNYHVRDFLISLGGQYSFEIDDHAFVFGITYDFSNSMFLRGDSTTITLTPSSSGTILDTLHNEVVYESSMSIPAKLGIGMSYTWNDRLTLIADYIQQDWTNLSVANQPIIGSSQKNIHFGMQFVPNKTKRSYLKRINYRIGYFNTTNYTTIQGTELNNKAVTFGLGLPFKNTKSSINFAAEIGTRGVDGQTTFLEEYYKFSVNFSLYDFWFYKKKYN